MTARPEFTRRQRLWPFAVLTLCWPLTGAAQDAVRGEALYRALPGQPGVASCISCHGEAVNNRNSVLRGAAGPALISKTVSAVGAMGYLRQYLGDGEFADIAAYLASVSPAGTVDALPTPSPTRDDFGALQIGTSSAERVILIRNLQAREDIAIGAVLSADPVTFPLAHDCPASLPPLGQCSARTWFRPQAAGPASSVVSIVGSGGRALRSGTLSGTGTETQAPALAWADADAATLDFGRVPVGQAASSTRVLVNTSAETMPLLALRMGGPNASRFTLDAPCARTGRIEAGASCEVRIGFAPSAAGRADGWLEIEAGATHPPLWRVTALGSAEPVASGSNEPVPDAPVMESGSAPGGGASGWGWLAALTLAVALLRRRH
jgi:cytochrome c553